jgi:hypothetical protein
LGVSTGLNTGIPESSPADLAGSERAVAANVLAQKRIFSSFSEQLFLSYLKMETTDLAAKGQKKVLLPHVIPCTFRALSHAP